MKNGLELNELSELKNLIKIKVSILLSKSKSIFSNLQAFFKKVRLVQK